QVECVSLVAGLVDRFALGERDLPEEADDALALGAAETAECGQREETLLAAWTQHGEWGRRSRGSLTAIMLRGPELRCAGEGPHPLLPGCFVCGGPPTLGSS